MSRGKGWQGGKRKKKKQNKAGVRERRRGPEVHVKRKNQRGGEIPVKRGKYKQGCVGFKERNLHISLTTEGWKNSQQKTSWGREEAGGIDGG